MKVVKCRRGILLAAMLIPILCGAQGSQEDEKREVLKILSERGPGVQLTAQQNEFVKRVWSQNHPPREFTGLIPLTDLGKRTYMGEEGGLYPGGKNVMPRGHLKAGLKMARRIVPLDEEGRPSRDGKIVFMWFALNEFPALRKLAPADTQRDSQFLMVDAFHTSQGADNIALLDPIWWGTADKRLSEAGVTAKQVQVIWLKPVLPWPWRAFPKEPKLLERYLADILHNAQARFPNLKIVYLSSRIYAGYSQNPASPEPYCYEAGFAVKWLIADQIAGNPDLNYDPARGPVRCPWLAWGPYLWSDGTKGRRDGLVWLRSDFASDGMHPSVTGREKIARMLLEFLRSDPTSRPWFIK